MINKKFSGYISTQLGFIVVRADFEAVTEIFFTSTVENLVLNSNYVIDECTAQLLEYFSGKRKFFDCQIKLIGTEFQKAVWQETLKIPYGKVVTYSYLASKVGRPSAYRAVANALGRNKLPIVVPCHRVLRSDGRLGGFSAGIWRKRALLELEGVEL